MTLMIVVMLLPKDENILIAEIESIITSVKVENAIKLYSCSECNYSSKDLGNFKRHQKGTHEGHGPWTASTLAPALAPWPFPRCSSPCRPG